MVLKRRIERASWFAPNHRGQSHGGGGLWHSQWIHGLVCSPGGRARCVEVDVRLDHRCRGGIKEGT